MHTVQELNGNVTFVLDADDADLVERFRGHEYSNIDHGVLASLLDHFGFQGNAIYMPILPENVGALTDAPMFTNEMDVRDDGSVSVTGDIWYYPAYEMRDFSEILMTEGKVTFKKVLH
jgi:hypothetical protein